MKIGPQAKPFHLVVNLQNQNDMKYTSNEFILNRDTYLKLLSPLFFKNKKILISNHCQNLRFVEATFPIGLLAFEGSSHRFSTYKCIFGSLKLEKSRTHHSTL